MVGSRQRGGWHDIAGNAMRVTSIGTDPAALYLGILLKRRQPSHVVRFIDCGDDVAALPATLVCNPVKPRFVLADAEALAVLNHSLVSFDTVVVKANGSELLTRGLKFASIDPAALAQRLKRLAL